MRKTALRLGGAMMTAACLTLAGSPAVSAEGAVRLFSAGSLKAALTEVSKEFEARQGTRVEATFGPSGILKQRLEAGEAADLFTSANMDHPRALHEAGLAFPVQAFARNQLCALARPQLAITPETMLDRLLDPAVRIGTSTPKADPAGDYAWQLFDKAEAVRPGSAEALKAKALQLSGGANSPKPPEGRTVYGWALEQDLADVYLTYCTNARLAVAEIPDLKIVAVPEQLAVGAVYGLVVMDKGDTAKGKAFADYIQSPAGVAILERHGFSRP
jgi:molybdate transport system substrate-binding protein